VKISSTTRVAWLATRRVSAGAALLIGGLVVAPCAFAADNPPPPPPKDTPAAPAQPPQPSPPTTTTPGGAQQGSGAPIGVAPTEAPLPPPPPTPPGPQPKPTKPPTEAAPAGVDDVPSPGYLPGYRAYQGLSLSPYTPRVGSLPGGLTPGYGAPMPPNQWTFNYSGFLTATLQTSLNKRQGQMPGQSSYVLHVPPAVVDEYASFLGTTTMPGQWIAMNFSYGNPIVSANVSLNTWSPNDPSTYYQIGAQYFINNAYLRFDIPSIGSLKLRSNVGYFYNYYGNLGQYTPGIYTNPLIGSPRGVGEVTNAEYVVSPTWVVLAEQGFMGGRPGKIPNGVVPAGGNNMDNPTVPSSWIHHLHLGIRRQGEPTIEARVHYMTNWAQDDRIQRSFDNPVTRQVNEAGEGDGHINVFGFDASLNSATWGFLAVGGSYTSAENAYLVRGLTTFGGEGNTLTDRWFGSSTLGTGKLYAAAINWGGSLGRILSAPAPFSSEGPDLVLNAGLVVAYSTNPLGQVGGATLGQPTDAEVYNDRLRYKFGVDGLYTFSKYMSVGVRGDRVAPNSKDSAETFYVLAPRVVFKTSWTSRENITILYAKWFYGSHTHPEASSILPTDVGLDDQLLAINVNVWW
jgi:hypothetical protein